MSGRKGKGGARIQRSPPPHLRLVEPDDDAPGLTPGYAQPIIEKVVANLLRDADHITDAALYALADAIIGHGFELYPEQAVVLRQTLFDMIAGALRARLLAGLSDTDIDDASDGRTRVVDDMSGIADEGEHILLDTQGGLMERFRAALAEDGEQS